MTTAPPDQQAPEGPGEDEGFAAEDRVLCVDEACIGLVGPDGRCKVCGKPGPAGAVATAGAGQAAAPPAEAGAGLAGDEVADVAIVDESAHPEEADDFTERRLCPDESCIGLLDTDGRCKVCGRSGPAI